MILFMLVRTPRVFWEGISGSVEFAYLRKTTRSSRDGLAFFRGARKRPRNANNVFNAHGELISIKDLMIQWKQLLEAPPQWLCHQARGMADTHLLKYSAQARQMMR